jgi:hypothetical protein
MSSFKVYPSLQIGNIIRSDSVLRFDQWCKFTKSINDSVPQCRAVAQAEELVQPYRCLHANSEQEDRMIPAGDCIQRRLHKSDECLRAERWEQRASIDCSNRSMILDSSLQTLTWCGLGEFRGVNFICCPLRGNSTFSITCQSCIFRIDFEANDDQMRSATNDDNDSNRLVEDDPINEIMIVPATDTIDSHHRILAESHSSTGKVT